MVKYRKRMKGGKTMKIEKMNDRVKLNVSAQGCKNDCTYWKTWNASAYKQLGKDSGCKKVTNARWCSWW